VKCQSGETVAIHNVYMPNSVPNGTCGQ
jgi:hypothetical protein